MNKINNTKTKLAFVLGMNMVSTAAFAQPEENAKRLAVGIVGMASIQNPDVKSSGATTSVSGTTTYGGGLTGGFTLSPEFSIEADLLYLNHQFSQTTAEFFGSELSSTFTSGAIHVPVLVRYSPITLVNLGLGVYYSRVITSWEVSAAGQTNTTTDWGKNDYGFVLAAGTLIPIGSQISILGDLRYTRSLTETARSSGDALKFSDFQLLAGIRISL